MGYDDDNIFAKILRGEIPCHKVYEDDATLAFMDIMPRADGHTLVVPKVKARNLLDIAAADLGPLMATVQNVARGVMTGMEADGITLQQFNEPAGGQVIFHFHFHVLPRWDGVKLRPHTGEMADEAILKGHAAKIAAAIEAL